MSSLLLDRSLYKQLDSFKSLWVAYSGGLDSTVLLHLLANSPFKSKIQVLHINHGLSPNADKWQLHGAKFCEQLGVPYHVQRVEFNRDANIEEHAREARYQVFRKILQTDDCLLLGHHQNDQAETVLLQLFRGAGIDGLSAMRPWGSLGAGRFARPLLECTQAELIHYAQEHCLSWIEDESNDNIHYSRNYLRQTIIPLLKARWPAVSKNLARTATHAQSALDNLQALANLDYPESLTVSSLNRAHLVPLDEKRISNVLRQWLRNNRIKPPSTCVLKRILDEIIKGREDSTPEVSWGGTTIRRYQNMVYLHTQNQTLPPVNTEIHWLQFPNPIVLPHNQMIIAEPASEGLHIPQQARIILGFRQGGEQLVWHQQTKSLKKLLQEWAIPVWERQTIPLIYIDEKLAAVGGYAVSDLFYSQQLPAWRIKVISGVK